jgi:hypothetical protein
MNPTAWIPPSDELHHGGTTGTCDTNPVRGESIIAFYKGFVKTFFKGQCGLSSHNRQVVR